MAKRCGGAGEYHGGVREGLAATAVRGASSVRGPGAGMRRAARGVGRARGARARVGEEDRKRGEGPTGGTRLSVGGEALAGRARMAVREGESGLRLGRNGEGGEKEVGCG